MTNKNFWDYLKDNLTASEYENLPEILGCGQKRLTWIRNGNTEFMLDEIKTLGRILQANPRDLIMEYGLGRKNISLHEMDQLAAMDGLKLDLVAHVA